LAIAYLAIKPPKEWAINEILRTLGCRFITDITWEKRERKNIFYLSGFDAIELKSIQYPKTDTDSKIIVIL